MPVFKYKTIEAPSEGSYKEKGSKFLAFAYPVQTEDEIKDALTALQKKYYDARHHCYAWILGAERKKFRAFDDGEPNHSAGDPILGQIKSRELTDVLVVVVRYFGGVKLGVGGLVSAYKTAADEALKQALIIEVEVTEPLTIIYDYASTPEVMRLIKEFDLTIQEQSFEKECIVNLKVRLSDKDRLLEKIQLLSVTGSNISVRADGQ